MFYFCKINKYYTNPFNLLVMRLLKALTFCLLSNYLTELSIYLTTNRFFIHLKASIKLPLFAQKTVVFLKQYNYYCEIVIIN